MGSLVTGILFVCGCFLVLQAGSSVAFSQSDDVPEIELDLTVSDKRKDHRTGLEKERFALFLNGKRQDMPLSIATDVPATVGILIDMSGSQDRLKFDRTSSTELLKNGLVRFVEIGNSANEYFILGFGEKSKVLLETTADRDRTRTAIRRVSGSFGNEKTAFFDALKDGLIKISKSKKEKRVLLLITDGIDTASKLRFRHIRDRLRESDVLVYTVLVGARSMFAKKLRKHPEPNTIISPGRFPTFSPLHSMRVGQKNVEVIGEISGGTYFDVEKAKDIEEAFKKLANELRSQYRLTFKVRAIKRGSGWNKLKIKLIPEQSFRGILVRTRKGFLF